ncbi:hypothetical protein PILCRDRAFT_822540 [Piloderma croceum F 1598]|uniref:Uncharacterized protein n=1 Tax=Piloderma croceum (strain F 1598) TaxID=765440 RepID=A0A0C3FKE1_PILCF|nr:hypothetical protein PILCRDRAFT_822540 [Piloderma croceum F 1598]
MPVEVMVSRDGTRAYAWIKTEEAVEYVLIDCLTARQETWKRCMQITFGDRELL